MKLKVFKVTFIVFLIITCDNHKNNSETVPPNVIKSAKSGLEKLKESNKNFSNAWLERPFKVFRIFHDTILNYEKYKNYNFNQIVADPGDSWIFPVFSRNRYTFLHVQLKKGAWINTGTAVLHGDIYDSRLVMNKLGYKVKYLIAGNHQFLIASKTDITALYPVSTKGRYKYLLSGLKPVNTVELLRLYSPDDIMQNLSKSIDNLNEDMKEYQKYENQYKPKGPIYKIKEVQ
jgi:hypothetical protein